MMNNDILAKKSKFKKWIWEDLENRLYIIFTLIITIASFTWLKYRYPHPNYLPDSFSYLEAALRNRSLNIWPIGYSAFLRIVSSFSNTDTFQVWIQYILLQTSMLYLVLSSFYLLIPHKWPRRLLILVCMANPLSAHISNFISSDSLFAAVSILWFTQLLWIIYEPNPRLLIFHAFVLAFALSVRYNALYYPVVSLIVILFKKMSTPEKSLAIVSTFILVGGFIIGNMYKYKKLTGIAQFSPSGGWQLASNALFTYAHLSDDELEKVPAKFRSLHRIVNKHKDSLDKLRFRPDSELGIYYLWDDHAPLKLYLQEKKKEDSSTDGFTRWASLGPTYAAYGKWLIREHPQAFFKYYICPNIINYYVPNTEFMSKYNVGADTVDEIAKIWFDYTTNKVQGSNKQITVVNVFPIIMAISNLLFFLCFLGFLALGGFKHIDSYTSKIITWGMIICLANLCFSVFASPVVLRYQIFPMDLTLVLSVVLMESIARECKSAPAVPDLIKSVALK